MDATHLALRASLLRCVQAIYFCDYNGTDADIFRPEFSSLSYLNLLMIMDWKLLEAPTKPSAQWVDSFRLFTFSYIMIYSEH